MQAQTNNEEKRLQALDRHELEKVLEKNNIEAFNYETADMMRETLQNLIRESGLSFWDLVFR